MPTRPTNDLDLSSAINAPDALLSDFNAYRSPDSGGGVCSKIVVVASPEQYHARIMETATYMEDLDPSQQRLCQGVAWYPAI